MKKVLFILLAALFLLVACDSGEGSQEDQKKEELPLEEIEEVEEATKEEPEVEPIEEVEDQKKEETKVEKKVEQAQTPKEASKAFTDEELKEIIEYTALSEDDELVNATFEKDEIIATIKLAPHSFLSNKDIALSSYAGAADELLTYEGWEILTITFNDVGTISMNRSEKESNEFDMEYFPIAKIEENLK